MLDFTILQTLAAVSAAALGCRAFSTALRGPADPGPLEDTYCGDTARNRAVMAALAVAATGGIVALICAGSNWLLQLALAVVSFIAAAAWLVVGGRTGYDAGARLFCTGHHGPHVVARGTDALAFPDGTVVCHYCLAAIADVALGGMP